MPCVFCSDDIIFEKMKQKVCWLLEILDQSSNPNTGSSIQYGGITTILPPGIFLDLKYKLIPSFYVANCCNISQYFGTNSYVCRSYRGKTGTEGGGFFPPSPILNRVKTFKVKEGENDKNNKLISFRIDDEKLIEKV